MKRTDMFDPSPKLTNEMEKMKKKIIIIKNKKRKLLQDDRIEQENYFSPCHVIFGYVKHFRIKISKISVFQFPALAQNTETYRLCHYCQIGITMFSKSQQKCLQIFPYLENLQAKRVVKQNAKQTFLNESFKANNYLN